MNSNNCKTNQENQSLKRKRGKLFFLCVFCGITLFLVSFSVTSFILMNSYRLTFASNSQATLQQEISRLKSEISRKDGEIEELKLRIAALEAESSFVNQTQ